MQTSTPTGAPAKHSQHQPCLTIFKPHFTDAPDANMSNMCDCAVDAPAASSDATQWSSESSIWLDQFEIRHTAPKLRSLPGYQADSATMNAQVAFTVVGESVTELGNDSDPTDGYARPGCLGVKLAC